MSARRLTNFTAEAIQDFLTGPDDPKPEPESSETGPRGDAGPAAAATGPAKPPKAAKQTQTPPAPVESQGEAPPLTMKET